MKKAIAKLEPFDKESECVNVIVETPKGSRVKISYDSDAGLFILSKALPEGMAFPFNFGFIPGTLSEDGDPLDMLILNEEPLFPGCWLKVKPLAIIKATQTEGKEAVRNDRLIGEAIGKETPPELESLTLTKRTVYQIEFFFHAYNKLYDKKFKVLGNAGPKQAWAAVKKARELFNKKKEKG